MNFNDKWTKEVNDEYRQMIKDKKSPEEIRKHFRDLAEYDPKKRFSVGLYTYERFMCLVNEIKLNPNYIDFGFNYFDSKRFKGKDDIYCFFNINEVEYILILEYLIENNSTFKDNVVYNVFFTTKEKFEIFDKLSKNLSSFEIEERFLELQEIVEELTNKNDFIKIMNALSYILLKMSNRIDNCIYMISETNNIRKFSIYKQTIEDSFDNYELYVDVSKFMPDRKSYYYILQNKTKDI